jgi:hypothetical protein
MNAASTVTLVGLGVALFSMPSRADEPAELPKQASTDAVQACVVEHERAGLLRREEQWLAARAAMNACSSESCPLAIRSDCRAWLDDLARLLPTILLVIERDDEGKEPALIELDGNLLELAQPGRPIEVLPGAHRLRVSVASYAPVERAFELEKGEKNRLIHIRFAREQPPAQATRGPMSDAGSPSVPTASRPIPISTYLLGGGALLAFATSTSLVVSALSARSQARDTCAPFCNSEDREAIESRLLIADISAGVGAILTGFALYTFLDRPVVYDRASQFPPSVNPLVTRQLHMMPSFSLRSSGATLSLGAVF